MGLWVYGFLGLWVYGFIGLRLSGQRAQGFGAAVWGTRLFAVCWGTAVTTLTTFGSLDGSPRVFGFLAHLM